MAAFLEFDDFLQAVLARPPAIALVTWKRQASLLSVIGRLQADSSAKVPGLRVEVVDCASDTAEVLSRRIAAMTKASAAGESVAVLVGFEPFIRGAAEVLNGFRETFAHLRALILCMRENRAAEFMRAAPDLMDWVGANIVRAEEVAPPLTLDELARSIHALEERQGFGSDEFLRRWDSGHVKDVRDAWLWRELLAVREEMQGDVA